MLTFPILSHLLPVLKCRDEVDSHILSYVHFSFHEMFRVWSIIVISHHSFKMFKTFLSHFFFSHFPIMLFGSYKVTWASGSRHTIYLFILQTKDTCSIQIHTQETCTLVREVFWVCELRALPAADGAAWSRLDKPRVCAWLCFADFWKQMCN